MPCIARHMTPLRHKTLSHGYCCDLDLSCRDAFSSSGSLLASWDNTTGLPCNANGTAAWSFVVCSLPPLPRVVALAFYNTTALNGSYDAVLDSAFLTGLGALQVCWLRKDTVACAAWSMHMAHALFAHRQVSVCCAQTCHLHALLLAMLHAALMLNRTCAECCVTVTGRQPACQFF
jgi:hypothetical protein